MPTGNNYTGSQDKMRLRKFRIGDRLNARQRVNTPTSTTLLTDEDTANLDEFASLITEATNILNQEIAAISDGSFAAISDLYDRKSTILKNIELRIPLVQPFLVSGHIQASSIAAKLGELKAAVTKDSALLERMAMAAGTIVKEIKRATERHSLKGLYGKSGQILTETTQGRMKIDKCL